jgi:PAS domain S-box-containing protein
MSPIRPKAATWRATSVCVRPSTGVVRDWDLRTHRVYYSREWKAQIGYDDHEIGDGDEEWASRVHPEDLDRMVRAVRATIEHRADYAHEFRFRHRDGSWRVIFTPITTCPRAPSGSTNVAGAG